MIVAAADGSALSNPGPTGWAWYISEDSWAAGGWDHGTNNMGELMAVLDLLRSTAQIDNELRVLCDSQYVINSITSWMPGWKRNGWRKKDGKPVRNVDLMQQLDDALQNRRVQFEWVKGHAGHVLNERADELARSVATAFLRGEDFDPGPGYRAADRPGRDTDPVRQSHGAPGVAHTWAQEPMVPNEYPVPGTASPQVKAAIVQATRKILSPKVRTDAKQLGAILHPEFVAHSADGQIITIRDVPWRETTEEFDTLAVDAYGTELASIRWCHAGNLRFSLWQLQPAGWVLRFAQVTPAAH